MELLGLKLVAFLLIFVAGVVGGLLPWWLGTKSYRERMTTLGLGFTSGIFLGAGILHMLPESQDHFAELGSDVHVYAVLFVSLGFMLVLFLEKVLVTVEDDDVIVTAGVSAYVLIFVLSVHSVITGISMGLSSTAQQVMLLILVISLHKLFAAFAVGMSFLSAEFSRQRYLTLILFFSLMAPLGIILGGLAASQFETSLTLRAEAVFDALAAGTFIYIATIDNMPKAFCCREDRWMNFGALCLGFGLMALLLLAE